MIIIDKCHTQVVNVNPAFQSYYFFTYDSTGKYRIMCNITSDGSSTPAVKVAEYRRQEEQMVCFKKLLEMLKNKSEIIDFGEM